MNKLELAELELRRAQDRYKAAMAEEQGSQPDSANAQEPQQPQPLSPNQRLIDFDAVISTEDVVAIAKILGMRVIVDTNNPAYPTVEHLVVEDGDQEAAGE